jgi:biopolymer transport protein ExbD
MGGGGGHEPNLTPLIDLFSVLIVFLLLTAALDSVGVFSSDN